MGFIRFSSKIIRKLLSKSQFCSAVITSAGSSQRMNGEDKLLIKIKNKPIIIHTLTAFQNCDRINEIVIVTREDSLTTIENLCKEYRITKVSKIITGGVTRTESVLNGVTAVSQKATLVAIHDAARPCIEIPVIEKTINMAALKKAAAPGVPVTSTIKKIKKDVIIETVNRDDLVEIQTPQVFDADLIKGALTYVINKSIAVTDDCMAVESLGVCVYVTPGSVNNIKLTTKADIPIIETILSQAGK